MNATKRLNGFCSECGGSIEFRADLIGTNATCPRCGKQTELMLAPPPSEPGLPRKVFVWTAVTAVILVAGLVALMVALNHWEKLAAERQDRMLVAREKAAAATGLEVSGIALEKGQGSSNVTVVAVVVNKSQRSRSQVGAEFYVFDGRGKTLSVARAFRPVLEPGAKWEIKVPVEGAAGAVSARLGSINEQP